ncbi:TonB family protein [Chitinimonas sp.]|uniref:energy transducer TonB n=1 Tax=Chitinimonas sp. TaxID=1934313 RepID=UPI002F9348C8
MSNTNLEIVCRRLPAGDGELSAPALGLSINQRKLLQWMDGQITVAGLAERLASGHAVETEQVLRDIERLHKLNLIVAPGLAAGANQPAASAQFARKKRSPLWLVGGGAVAVVGGLLAFGSLSGNDPKPAAAGQQVAANGAAGGEVAEEPKDEKIFGVMPNPGRWFSPGQKPEPKPEPAPAAKPETKPADNKLAQATPAKPAAAPAAVTPAAVSQPVAAAPAPVQAAPEPAPAKVEPVAPPVQVASAQPAQAKPPAPAAVVPPPPNRKPIYRESPEFPREASRNGVDTGTVKARMTVNEAGQVVKVDIIDAKPRRVFDRAVVAALSKWKFQQAASGFTVDTEIEFKDN